MTRFIRLLLPVIGILSVASGPVTADSVQGAERLPGVEAQTIDLKARLTHGHAALGGDWRGYALTLDDISNEAQRLRVLDRNGVVVKEIRATYFNAIRVVRFSQDGQTALWIQAAPESNIYRNKRTYLFLAKPEVHAALLVKGYVDHVRLLGRNRVLLICGSFAVMEWVGDLCHACAPDVAMVIGLKHGRFALVNHRYPTLSSADAIEYRQRLSASSADFDTGSAIGYYANLATIGRGREALRYLRHHLSAAAWRKFREVLPDVRRRLRAMPTLFWVDNSRRYVVNDP